MAELPPYKRIATYYERLIRRGELAAGAPFPPARAIAADNGVARATADRAITWLRDAGLVNTTVGVGTTVAENQAEEVWSTRLSLSPRGKPTELDRGVTRGDSPKVFEPSEGVTMKVTRYTVSAIPEDNVNARHYAIQIVYVPPGYCEGGWRVEHGRDVLDRDGVWDGDWVPERDVYHDLHTALGLACDAAPKVTCNGWTVDDVLQGRVGRR